MKKLTFALAALALVTGCGDITENDTGEAYLSIAADDIQKAGRAILRENPCRKLVWIQIWKLNGDTVRSSGGFSTIGYVESEQVNCPLPANPRIYNADAVPQTLVITADIDGEEEPVTIHF